MPVNLAAPVWGGSPSFSWNISNFGSSQGPFNYPASLNDGVQTNFAPFVTPPLGSYCGGWPRQTYGGSMFFQINFNTSYNLVAIDMNAIFSPGYIGFAGVNDAFYMQVYSNANWVTVYSDYMDNNKVWNNGLPALGNYWYYAMLGGLFYKAASPANGGTPISGVYMWPNCTAWRVYTYSYTNGSYDGAGGGNVSEMVAYGNPYQDSKIRVKAAGRTISLAKWPPGIHTTERQRAVTQDGTVIIPRVATNDIYASPIRERDIGG